MRKLAGVSLLLTSPCVVAMSSRVHRCGRLHWFDYYYLDDYDRLMDEDDVDRLIKLLSELCTTEASKLACFCVISIEGWPSSMSHVLRSYSSILDKLVSPRYPLVLYFRCIQSFRLYVCISLVAFLITKLMFETNGWIDIFCFGFRSLRLMSLTAMKQYCSQYLPQY